MNITLSNIEKLGILREEALGRVYEGIIQEPHRKVLVKELILPPVLDKTCGIRIKQRFFKEAETLKNILNPAIAVPLAIGEEEQSSFVIYPLPQGIPLNSHIETKGPIPKEEALLLTKRIVHCYQLLLTHDIHRANIIPHDFFLQGNSSFQFLDTTLCTYDKTYGLYDIGLITGDRNFYAPEQIEKGKTSEQSLIFSIGLMLYWILTGELLYDGDTPFECFSRILTKEYTSLPERLDPSLETYDLMRHILQKDEAKRFATLQILEQSIDQVLDRERVERTLKEQEEKFDTERVAVPGEKAPVRIGKYIPWILFIFLLFCMGLHLKKCFFIGYEKVHTLSPESLENLRNAWRSLADNDLEEARRLATDVLKKEKTSPEASLIVGETHIRLGDYEQSISFLEQGKKALDDKIYYRSSHLLAMSFIRLERFPEAEIEVDGLIRKIESVEESLKPQYKKNLSELCYLEGTVLFQKYREDAAILRRLQKIEAFLNRIDPACPQMDFIKGIISYVNKEDMLALAYLKLYKERFPGDSLVSEILQKLEQPQTPSTP
jgi:serine/threonine protein kinase